MTSDAIRIEHLYKKFRRGEVHDSLRDLVPALSRRMMKRLIGKDELGAQEFWALNDINLTIPKGGAVGIIGHNGAGKSTLLKHLTGVLGPTRGTIDISGRVSALIEVGAGFHPYLTGRENVFLNGVILGMTIQEIRRKFDEIVDFSGLAEFIDTPVRRYSSGMFARLGFSVAAHLDPEILLIDEVLSVGDLVFQKKGVEKMQAIAESGATVIFVSHNMRSVQLLCQRCLLMDTGRIIADGPTSEIIGKYIELGQSASPEQQSKTAVFENFQLMVEGQRSAVIEPGQEFTIGGRIRFLETVPNMDVGIGIVDPSGREIMHMSLARLGLDASSATAGDSLEFSIGARAHFLAGMYQVQVDVRNPTVNKVLAALRPKLSLFVQAPPEPRGVINVYPRAVSFSRHAA